MRPLLAAALLFASPLAFAQVIPTQVSGGETHTCALTTSGGVKCWGDNTYGQLGNGTLTPSATPVDVSGLSSVAAIAAGMNHTCALTTAGGVTCWGANGAGQLGDGTSVNGLVPVNVSGLASGVAAIDAGGAHTCALTTAGGIKCWGANADGQIGDNSATNRLTPVNVQGLASGVTAISAGTDHTCAVTTAGAAKCWGSNAALQLGDGTNVGKLVPTNVVGLASGVKAISAGNVNSCALTTAGGVKCWGNNFSGQIGDGTVNEAYTPVDVTGLASGVSSITVGGFHVCAITSAGGAKCWGANSGQLGNGNIAQQVTPVDVVGFTTGVGALAAGRSHTCLIPAQGGLKCFGRNQAAQLGDGTTTNRLVPTNVLGFATDVVAIASGGYHSCALMASGGVKCWGLNNAGQLGDNSFANRTTPVDVVGLSSGVAAITAGFRTSCALTAAGGMKCWGHNSNGELGDGTFVHRATPADVSGLTSGVAAMAAGDYHTCALTTGGAVKCWGWNGQGQLGNGVTDFNVKEPAPVDVTGLGSGVVALAAGAAHNCAVMTNGAVKCWGHNFGGALGDGTTINRNTPVDVVGFPASGVVVEVASGGYFNCVRTTPGAVKCWGVAYDGQLGNNDFVDSSTPVDVSGLASGVASVSTGDGHACARTTGGAMKCWGRNGSGQLGDGTNTTRYVPVDVSGLASGVTASDANGSHTCALTSSGMKCWGQNDQGQLGNGTQNWSNAPAGYALGATQSIAFAPGAGMLGTPIPLSATASSGLAVVFDTWTPGTCTVSGNTATPIAAGLCGVRASQAGGSGYAPAPQQLRLIAITPITFNVVLEGAQEVPVNGSPATGSGTVIVDTAANTLTYSFSYTDLTGTYSMAHFHGPGARGVLAGVKIDLTANPTGGTVNYNEADEADILAGHWYFNVHTTTFGGGEIRGQLDNLGAAPRHLLTISKAGTGAGLVTSDVGGIDCGATCTYNSPVGLVISLGASPAGGSAFAGWSGGGCSGTGACMVTMSAAATVTATFNAAAPSGPRPRDLSGDGNSDILLRGPGGEIVAWLMNGNSISAATLMLGAGTGYQAQKFGDFNGDGKQDLLVVGSSGELVVWLMDGASVSTSALILGGGTGYVVDKLGDFDGDGKTDILFKGASGDLVMWLMNGASVASSAVVLGGGTGFAPVAVGEFNDDGKDDIVIAHTDGRVTMWLMNGSTIASSANLLGAGTGYVVSHVGDFNNDAKDDLLFKGAAGEIVMWQMNGTTIAGSFLLSGATPWIVSHIADVNGDAFDDMALKGPAGEIVIWQMNGATITGATLMYGGGPWVISHVGDYNGDGNSDFLLKGPNGEIVVWIMNGSAITSATLLVGATTWSAAP